VTHRVHCWAASVGSSVPDSRLLSQYGAKALDRVLSTILSNTESRVPVPKSYDGGEAAFFHGKSVTSSGVSCWLGGSRVWDA